MKTYLLKMMGIALTALGILAACEDFIEVDAPDYKIIGEEVFNNDETAMSALQGIYNELFNASFINGSLSSVSVLCALSADDLKCLKVTDHARLEFEQNNILSDNEHVANLWSSAYNIIYMVNSLLEGMGNSNQISQELRKHMEGEAKFVRAFTYFQLINLFGDVPLLLTTDYRVNSLAARNTKDEVYLQVIKDLRAALEVLGGEYRNGDRTQVNKYVAMALLARVYLYLDDWEMAEEFSGNIIEETATYEILTDLDQVFLANSREAIWQLSPIGRGSTRTNTNEGGSFIIHPIFPSLSNLKLAAGMVDIFSAQDKRLSHWTSFHEGANGHYPFKYKIRNSTAAITEYSMVLRLAEQILIRAEAMARMGNIGGAIAQLDIIRSRSGLELLADTDPGIGEEALIQAILEERRKELFTEWGHRWFDLKRTGSAGEVLGNNRPLWQDTDLLYPIPEGEREKNPNLGQNPGY